MVLFIYAIRCLHTSQRRTSTQCETSGAVCARKAYPLIAFCRYSHIKGDRKLLFGRPFNAVFSIKGVTKVIVVLLSLLLLSSSRCATPPYIKKFVSLSKGIKVKLQNGKYKAKVNSFEQKEEKRAAVQ